MQRDALLLGEMIDAVEQIVSLTEGTSVDDLTRDRRRRDALLWNFTVLGEAATQVSGHGAALAGDPMAPTGTPSGSDRARLLVDRPRDPPHDGLEPATWFVVQLGAVLTHSATTTGTPADPALPTEASLASQPAEALAASKIPSNELRATPAHSAGQDRTTHRTTACSAGRSGLGGRLSSPS